MSLSIENTNTLSQQTGIKVLVYGPAGAGKTRLISTTGDLDNTLILSAEAGLLSLREHSIDVFQVTNLDAMREAYGHLKTGNHHYKWICIDSISEIAEVCLAEEKARSTDGRKAYGELADTMFKLIRGFRNLPVNVYMSAKQTRYEVDGGLVYAPLLPGRQLKDGIPYLFDEVFALRCQRGEENNVRRFLQTDNDGFYDAKDRSGALEMVEPPNLEHIRNKIINPAAQ